MERTVGGEGSNTKRVKYSEKRKQIFDDETTLSIPKRRYSKRTNGVIFEKEVIRNSRQLQNGPRDNIGILSIPIEILLEIMSYLDCRDLYALREVSKYFQRLVLEPSVWTSYEVSNNTGASTSDVIEELKRMPHLRRISIEARNDCDDILRQLSCSNKKLQRLNISNCTGTSGNLYLRPGFLTRILERCTKLHTITIRGSRFRGLKFYRILGNMGHRLRFVSASTTCMQFRTFVRHVTNLEDHEREALCSMCPGGARRWGPLRYYTVEKSDHSKTALVSYFYHDFFDVPGR